MIQKRLVITRKDYTDKQRKKCALHAEENALFDNT